MLTRLRLKNWRSIKEETIEFAPITVFIGANSSGKTNILDAMYFLRHAVSRSVIEAFNMRVPPDHFRRIGVPNKTPVEIELSVQVSSNPPLSYLFSEYEEAAVVHLNELLKDEKGNVFLESDSNEFKVRDKDGNIEVGELTSDLALSAFGRTNIFPQIQTVFQFIAQRWHMLDENFMPPLSVSTSSGGDPYVMDRCAENLSVILAFMAKNHHSVYASLQEDFGWLLGHVEAVETKQTDYDIRTLIREKLFTKQEAPTVSAGTARILAMLTAYYALDMRFKEMPGLVAIEEPDTALNPMLLQNFVEQLRNYVEGEHPRQFILTTHNPLFLNYFKPEEVRVVERDEEGYTTVHKIPDYIEEIWLKDGAYRLGDVWMTRSMGGVPE